MNTYLSFNYPTEEQYRSISKYTNNFYEPTDVYICRIQILDNNLDRDFTKVSSNALEELGKKLVGKRIKVKEYFVDQKRPTEYTMTILNFCVSTFLDQKTKDGEHLKKLYVDAYVPVKNISSVMMKQIEDKVQGASICSFSFGSYVIKECAYFSEKYKVLTSISDAYEVELEFPCREERKKWLVHQTVADTLQENGYNKQTGEALKEISECTLKTTEHIGKMITSASSSKDISALTVPIAMEFQPIRVENTDKTYVQLSRSEVKNLIDFFDMNMQMNLQLDDMWDGNMAYLCEMCGIYNKLVSAKECLEKRKSTEKVK